VIPGKHNTIIGVSRAYRVSLFVELTKEKIPAEIVAPSCSKK
jgi:hypothetical protein